MYNVHITCICVYIIIPVLCYYYCVVVVVTAFVVHGLYGMFSMGCILYVETSVLL